MPKIPTRNEYVGFLTNPISGRVAFRPTRISFFTFSAATGSSLYLHRPFCFFISWRDDELSRRQIDTPVAEDGFVVVVVLVVGIVVVNGPEKTFWVRLSFARDAKVAIGRRGLNEHKKTGASLG